MKNFLHCLLCYMSAILLLININSCRWFTNSPPYHAVPKSAVAVFESRQWKNLESNLNEKHSGSLVSQLTISKLLFSNFREIVDLLSTDASVKQSLESAPCLQSVHLTSANDIGILLSAPLSGINDNSLINHLQNLRGVKAVRVRVFNQQKIIEAELIGGKSVTVAMLKGTLCASLHSFLVENAVTALLNGEGVSEINSFSKCVKQADKGTVINVYIDFQKLNTFLPLICNPEHSKKLNDISSLGEWTLFNFTFTNDDIKINGYSPVIHQTPRITYKIMQWIPDNAAVATVCVDTTYSANKLSAPYFKNWAEQPVALVNTASFSSQIDKQNILILPTNSRKTAERDLREWLLAINESVTPCDTILGHPVYEVKDAASLSTITRSSFFTFPSVYFTVADNFVLFTAKKEVIQYALDKINNGEVLSNHTHTQPISECTNCNNGTLNYVQIEKAEGVIHHLIPPTSTLNKIAEHADYAMIAKVLHQDHISIEGILKLGSLKKRNMPETMWQTRLNAPAITSPVCITKSDGEKIIFVQDTLMNLYAIDISGEIIFVKKLSEKVWNKVYEVDYYGNGTEHQFLFSTPSKVHLVNYNGDDFAGYPIRFSAPSTTALTVSSDRKKYFVPCINGSLYGYAISGKPLAGFSPKNGIGSLSQDIEIVKNKNREYLVANNTMGNLILIGDNGETVWSMENLYGFKVLQSSSTFQLFSAQHTHGIVIDAEGNDKTVALKDTATLYEATIINDSVIQYYIANNNYVKWYDMRMNFKGAFGTKPEIVKDLKLLRTSGDAYLLLNHGSKFTLLDRQLKEMITFDSIHFTVEQLTGSGKVLLIEADEKGYIVCRALN